MLLALYSSRRAGAATTLTLLAPLLLACSSGSNHTNPAPPMGAPSGRPTSQTTSPVGPDWTSLEERPVRIRRIPRDARCPVTNQWRKMDGHWESLYGARKVLGSGPMFPLGPWPYPHARLFVTWRKVGDRKLAVAKILWGWEGPPGPVVIRGRQLDGNHPLFVGFGVVHHSRILRITTSGRDGARPTLTAVPHAGCYAWQVDGTSFEKTIVFSVPRRSVR